MNEKELLELGFIDTSYYEEEELFSEFTLTTEKFKIQVSGIDTVEFQPIYNGWVDVNGCKDIEGIRQLIKLFS